MSSEQTSKGRNGFVKTTQYGSGRGVYHTVEWCARLQAAGDYKKRGERFISFHDMNKCQRCQRIEDGEVHA